jgi:hypothetical protein
MSELQTFSFSWSATLQQKLDGRMKLTLWMSSPQSVQDWMQTPLTRYPNEALSSAKCLSTSLLWQVCPLLGALLNLFQELQMT